MLYMFQISTILDLGITFEISLEIVDVLIILGIDSIVFCYLFYNNQCQKHSKSLIKAA